jgi:hypothetical protein
LCTSAFDQTPSDGCEGEQDSQESEKMDNQLLESIFVCNVDPHWRAEIDQTFNLLRLVYQIILFKEGIMKTQELKVEGSKAVGLKIEE